jgi:Arc/MetJ family transcription regulator
VRTTVNIDDALLDAAAQFTGIEERSKLVNAVFEHYVAAQSAKRLRALSGKARDFGVAPRSKRRDVPQESFLNEGP